MDACAPYCPCKREYDRGPGDPDAHDPPGMETPNYPIDRFTDF